MEHKEIKFDAKSVHFKNETSKALKQRYDDIKPILEQFIGKKVKLSSGKLSKAFSDANEAIKTNFDAKPYKENHHAIVTYYWDASYNSFLVFNLTVCFSGGSYETKDYYCVYEKNSFHFDIDKEGNFINFPNLGNGFSNQIDANEQEALISEYNKTLEKLRELKYKIKI